MSVRGGEGSPPVEGIHYENPWKRLTARARPREVARRRDEGSRARRADTTGLEWGGRRRRAQRACPAPIASLLAHRERVPEARSGRVDAIRQALAEGRYVVAAESVAERMLSSLAEHPVGI